MARLPDYRAQKRLNTGSAPLVQTDRSGLRQVGQAGAAISNAGAATLEMIKRREELDRKREEFGIAQEYERFQLDLKEDFDRKLEASAVDGTGFHDDIMQKSFGKKSQDFFKTIPEHLQPEYAEVLSTDSRKWSLAAATAERDRMRSHAASVIGQKHNNLLNQIGLDIANYPDALAGGNHLIDASPLPEDQKAEARRNWVQNLQIAMANKLIADDPQTAFLALGGGTKDQRYAFTASKIRNALIQKETGGTAEISPKGAVGIMMITPDTAKGIAEELGDKNFPKDEAEIAEYLNDPENNIRYGMHNLEKQLKTFDGDTEAALVGYNVGTDIARKWLDAGRDYSVLPERSEAETYVAAILGAVGLSPGKRIIGGAPHVSFKFRAKNGEYKDATDANWRGVNTDLRNRVATAFASIGETEIKVNSGLRNPFLNAKVGGKPKSQHLHGNALDLNVSHLNSDERVALIERLSAVGITGIGIGSTIVHADLGARRSWGYGAGGSTTRGDVPGWAEAAVKNHLAGAYDQGLPTASGVDPRLASLSYDTRQKLIGAASRSMTKKTGAAKQAELAAKADLKTLMQSDLESIEASGENAAGLEMDAISNLLGEAETQKHLKAQQHATDIYNATANIPTSSDAEIDDILNQTEPRPASPNFANEQRVYEAAQAEAERVRELRQDKPGEAALLYPDVAEARDAIANKAAAGQAVTSDEMVAFIQQMEATQREFGTDKDALQVIPISWAKGISRLFLEVPSLGDASRKEIVDSAHGIYDDLAGTYGEFTDEVISLAIRQVGSGLDKDTSDMIAALMGRIKDGEILPRHDVAQVEDTAESAEKTSRLDPAYWLGFDDRKTAGSDQGQQGSIQ